MQTSFFKEANGKYPIVEIFKSLEGEGIRTGTPTVFVRFAVCNLNCKWCDTSYSHAITDAAENLTKEELTSRILSYKCKQVTFTGGEPLLKGKDFILWFATKYPEIEINIETNGSQSVEEFLRYSNVIITMDYKCPSSGQTDKMKIAYLNQLRHSDVLKFVVADDLDLSIVLDIMYNNCLKVKNIYLSPVFGDMDLQKLAQFVIEHDYLDLRMGLQIHKFIWDPQQRGV